MHVYIYAYIYIYMYVYIYRWAVRMSPMELSSGVVAITMLFLMLSLGDEVGDDSVSVYTAALQHTAALQRTATLQMMTQPASIRSDYTARPHTATHCMTLRHTATPCDTV